MTRSHIVLLLEAFLFVCFFCNKITSDGSRDQYNNRLEHSLSFTCYTTTNNTTSFQNNVNLLLSDFNVVSSLKSFYSTTIGDNPDAIYGYYMCRGDLTQQLCKKCIVNGTEFVTKSSCGYKDGTFLSEKCLFGYSNHSTYGLLEKESALAFDYVEANVSNHQQFTQRLSSTVTSLINEAAFETSKDGFATKEGNVTGDETIYSMAQCTPDIVGVNCSKCLKSAFDGLQRWANGAPGGIAYMAKCQLRYDNVSFYDVGDVGSSNVMGLRPNLLGVYLVVLLLIYAL